VALEAPAEPPLPPAALPRPAALPPLPALPEEPPVLVPPLPAAELPPLAPDPSVELLEPPQAAAVKTASAVAVSTWSPQGLSGRPLDMMTSIAELLCGGKRSA
jgi:hypothetical protein